MNKRVSIFKFLCLKYRQFFLLALSIILGLNITSNFINLSVYLFFLAIICGLYISDYLYQQKTIDFYYSLPIKRSILFRLKALVGYCYLIVIIVLNMIVAYILNLESFSFFIVLILLTTQSYFLTLLLCSICNNRVDAIVLSFIVPIICITGLIVVGTHYYQLTGNYLPFINFETYFTNHLALLTVIVGVVSLACFLLAIKINQNRKVECIGGTLSFPKIYPMLKISSTYIYLGVGTTIVFNQDIQNMIDLIILMKPIILLGLIIYLIGVIIETKKIDKILKHVFTYLLIVVSYCILYMLILLLLKPEIIHFGGI